VEDRIVGRHWMGPGRRKLLCVLHLLADLDQFLAGHLGPQYWKLLVLLVADMGAQNGFQLR
jgi:hypothetical protein